MSTSCQTLSGGGTAPARVQVDLGVRRLVPAASLGVSFDFRPLSGRGFAVQSVVAGPVERIAGRVTGPNIVGELTAVVSRWECPSGVATLAFSNLPPGRVDVAVNAFDAAGTPVVWAKLEGVDIQPGSPVTVRLPCTQDPAQLEHIDLPIASPTPVPSLSPCEGPCVPASSDFERGTDGWGVTGDGSVPVIVARDGNQGGALQSTDRPRGLWWYFSAPAKFLGNKACLYGGELAYEFKTTIVDRDFGADVILEGGGLTLQYDAPPPPKTVWKEFSAPLSEKKWVLAGTKTIPSREQFLSVLACLSRLTIRGEHSGFGGDVGSLDNVVLIPPR